jgi:drug/metabolite transporter (DMT)-like permease
MLPQNKTSQAMLLMLASMMCFALMNIIISWMATRLHSGQMVMVRNGISLLMVFTIVSLQQKRFPRFATKRMSGHFGRAAAGLIAMQLWFHSVTIMPVTLVTALSFTTPIFSTIIAIFWLKEHAGIRRWCAMLVSFAGVILILRPDIAGIDAKALFVLGASAAMAVAGVFVKNLSSTEAPETIVFYMALFMTPLSVPLGIYYWTPLMTSEWAGLLLIAVLSTTAQLMMARAYKRADMVVLLPLDFTRLIFTSFFAYLCFGEVLDSRAWLGAGVIVASTLYISHRETMLNRKAAKIKNITL